MENYTILLQTPSIFLKTQTVAYITKINFPPTQHPIFMSISPSLSHVLFLSPFLSIAHENIMEESLKHQHM